METPGAAVIAAVVGYLLGSIPVAQLVARREGVDLLAVGDRNPGFWNARSHLPRRTSALVFAGDAGKGALAAAIGRALPGPWWVGYVAAGAAMVGHAWPVFARFRGGRSVLTFVGAMVVLSPLAAAISALACIVVTVVTRRFAWGARVGIFGFPVVQAFMEPRAHVAATGALMCLIGLRFAMAAVADRRRAVSAVAPPPPGALRAHEPGAQAGDGRAVGEG
jgi:glycerol-3-phosphate acyltransferase PlsY